MPESLNSALPYWDFESKPFAHAVLWDASISAGFELTPMDIDCADDEKINRITLGLRTLLNSLPENLSIQFFVRTKANAKLLLGRHADLVQSTHEFLLTLDNERRQLVETRAASGAVLRTQIYVFLKQQGAEPKNKTSFFGSRKKFSFNLLADYETRLQQLEIHLEAFASGLEASGLAVRELNVNDLTCLAYEALNPERSKRHAAPIVGFRPASLEDDSPRNQIALSDLIIDRDDFVLDGIRTRVLTLKTLPEVSIAGMMNQFLAFPFEHDLTVTFTVPDQRKEMKSLESRRRTAHSLAGGPRLTDLESESRLSQTTDLIREIIETGQKIFYAEVVVTLRQSDKFQDRHSLDRHETEVLSRFRRLSGSEGIRETVASWKIAKNELPAAPLDLVRAKRLKTNNLADFLPIYGASRGDEDRPLVITETRRNSLFAFDSFSSELVNFNTLITGSSGSGKSFANNFLLLQEIARGIRAYIIDIGGSYRKLTELLNGQYFELDLSGRYSVNPLELPDPSKKPSAEKVKSLVNIIEQMVTEQGESLPRLERVLIEEALTRTFETQRRTNPTQSPLLSDFRKQCAESFETELRRIALLLSPWVGDSPFGQILDRPGSISSEKSVVAFDLKGLSQYPDLQTVLILILTNFLLQEVDKNPGIQKRVVLDEAWQFLKSAPAASFIEYASRTFRKSGSGITFTTQGL